VIVEATLAGCARPRAQQRRNMPARPISLPLSFANLEAPDRHLPNDVRMFPPLLQRRKGKQRCAPANIEIRTSYRGDGSSPPRHSLAVAAPLPKRGNAE
jgi:hypothetical protein